MVLKDFIAYAFKGQVHVFAGRVKIVKSLILQDKIMSPVFSEMSRVMRFLTLWYIYATSKASDQPALTCSLIRAFANGLRIL